MSDRTLLKRNHLQNLLMNRVAALNGLEVVNFTSKSHAEMLILKIVLGIQLNVEEQTILINGLDNNREVYEKAIDSLYSNGSDFSFDELTVFALRVKRFLNQETATFPVARVESSITIEDENATSDQEESEA